MSIVCLLLCLLMVLGDKMAATITYFIRIIRYVIQLNLINVIRFYLLSDQTVSLSNIKQHEKSAFYVMIYSGIYLTLLDRSYLEHENNQFNRNNNADEDIQK